MGPGASAAPPKLLWAPAHRLHHPPKLLWAPVHRLHPPKLLWVPVHRLHPLLVGLERLSSGVSIWRNKGPRSDLGPPFFQLPPDRKHGGLSSGSASRYVGSQSRESPPSLTCFPILIFRRKVKVEPENKIIFAARQKYSTIRVTWHSK